MAQTGLFLGAGASYELGMPLVRDVTIELKRWLTPEKLVALNARWNQDGTGYPDSVIDDLLEVIKKPDAHYEMILGHLENQHLKRELNSEAYHGIYSWLIEVVYLLLQERHTLNLGYIQKNIRYFEGFKSLVSENCPLWVFSLNHDLIVECLAAQFGVKLSAGYSSEIVNLPRRDVHGNKIGEIRAEVFSGEQLENESMLFLGPQESGINLLKIHGALDVFTFRNGKDLLKILPAENSIAGLIESLRITNEELRYVNRDSPERPIRTTNEINYEDDVGEMQFLRRTLLSGAYKYNSKMSQVLPMKLLDHFKLYLNNVSRLICVGYGFGDSHIDKALSEWLAACPSRNLEIVNPGISDLPLHLIHLESQIKLMQSDFSDYLDNIAGIKRERMDTLQKQMGALGRQNQHNPEKKKELGTFIEKFLSERCEALLSEVRQLPMKDGKVDFASVGMTVEEFTKQVLESSSVSIEDMMERFLKNHS